MIEHCILNNFVSGSTSINQIVHLIFTNMSKTYFCELVSGFFLNLNQTTAVIISGLSRSIIIEKNLNFVLC